MILRLIVVVGAALVLAAPASAASSRPSGTIAYGLLGSPPSNNGIYTAPAAGGKAKKLISGLSGSPVFSPDGKQIAFSIIDAKTFTQGIAVMPAGGGKPRVLAHQGNAPSWSPDGQSIVFATGNAVAVVPAAGGEIRTIVPYTPQIAIDFPVYASATQILYVSTPLIPTETSVPSSTLFSVPVDGGVPTAIPLTAPAGKLVSEGELRVSPDGRQVLISLYPAHPSVTSKPALALAPIAGGTLTPIAGAWLNGSFSPDGTQLCVAPNPALGASDVEPIAIVTLTGRVVSRPGVNGGSCSWKR
jgi:Tol biopolymer transport system component